MEQWIGIYELLKGSEVTTKVPNLPNQKIEVFIGEIVPRELHVKEKLVGQGQCLFIVLGGFKSLLPLFGPLFPQTRCLGILHALLGIYGL